MKRFLIFTLALALAPAMVCAQAGPPPGPGDAAPTAAQLSVMQQMHAQFAQARQQRRAGMLAALTPQHRTAVATVVGGLALAVNPDLNAAARQLDAILSSSEKQSIVSVDAAQHAAMQTLMRQHRAAFEATLSAAERAQIAQREANMQAYAQSHPRPAARSDPGAIVLRTLGNFGGHVDGHGFDGGMHALR